LLLWGLLLCLRPGADVPRAAASAAATPRPHHVRHGPAALRLGLGRVLSVELHELLMVLVVRPSQVLAYGHQVPEALDVLRVLLVYLLVQLQGLGIVVHPPVAGSHHEAPLDLVRLNLAGALKVVDALLVHLVLDEPHAEPGYDIEVDGVVPVALELVVEALALLLLLAEDLAQPAEDAGICGHPCDEDVEPLRRLLVLALLLVEVRNLVDDGRVVGDDGVQLLEGLAGLVRGAHPHVR